MSSRSPAETLQHLVGLECVRTRLVAGGMLLLYIGRVFESGLTEWGLHVDAAWRLERMHGSPRILGGYRDDEALLLPRLRGLHGAAIRQVEIDDGSGDLVITFEREMVLRTFTLSLLDEQWQLRRADGYRLSLGPEVHLAETTEPPKAREPKQ